jgi:membrane-bound lytic murein transglycosylase MltF
MTKAFTLLALLFCAQASKAQEGETVPRPHQLTLSNQPWHGDLEGMLERRFIRVLVPYSRTLSFVERGHSRGITAEVVHELEHFLNLKYAKRLRNRPITVALLPTSRDKLLSGVTEGLGDIAAGNLTVTTARQQGVDFVIQTGRSTVRELVITGPESPAVQRPEDLSGQKVYLRESSSYAESVRELNARLRAEGKQPAEVVFLPEALEDEDLLEMANAGLLGIILVDDWKARIWARVLPKLTLHENLSLRDDGAIGWAIRKGSPQLAAELADFFAKTSQKWGGFDSRIVTFQRRIRQIVDNGRSAEMRRFEKTSGLFEKYGKQYGFDILMLMAQGFQESRLRQEARSPVGAIGVMQIMPATGKEMKVGDITLLEPNIHAGTKYMSQLMTRYFADASFDEVNRPLFAFASYNAGPGAIARLRREAGKRGLDANVWFNNVELVVADRIGIETTTYVRNIYKYYAAYRLMASARDAQRAAKEKGLGEPATTNH